MPAPGDIDRKWLTMLWVDTDFENRCSLYAVRDKGMFGWLSLVFCNTTRYRNASKSIRLYPTIPCAIVPNVSFLHKAKFWDMDADGYGEVLNRLLRRPNSRFPWKTNWERTWKLFFKAGFGTCYNNWRDYAKLVIPDYSRLWGVSSWEYLDFDPDDAIPIALSQEYNMSVYVSAHYYNILCPDDNEESGLLVFDDYERYRAKRVARISIFVPEYLGWHPHSYACDKNPWILSRSEKERFIKLLKSANKTYPHISNWQEALNTFKRENLVI